MKKEDAYLILDLELKIYNLKEKISKLEQTNIKFLHFEGTPFFSPSVKIFIGNPEYKEEIELAKQAKQLFVDFYKKILDETQKELHIILER